MISPIILAVVFGLVVLLLLSSGKKAEAPDGTPLPPGPKGKPIIGNLLDIPPFHSWFQFEKWAKQFGPLYKLNIAGRTHVIVSKESIANDLLRERGNTYSSREQLPMAAKLLSKDLRPLFLPYDTVWRNGRKLTHALINTRIAPTYEPVQEEESLRVLYDLIRQPDKYETWFERYSAGLIMRLAYSKFVYTGEESYVVRILKVVHTVERVASPGAYLVDTLPFLLYLPSFLAPFKREAKELHEEELDLFTGLIKEVEGKMESGELQEDNFTSKWASAKEQYGLTDYEAAYVIGTLFEAGAGTTAAAMMSFMLAMTLYPEAFQKLKAEVDSVVGSDKFPTFKDMENLPRVRATAKEVLRWRPVTAGGLPHMSTTDDTYQLPSGEKVFLPAGTNVHPVQWSIHREEALYPQPEDFVPERWLEPGWPTYKEPLTTYPNLQNFSSFGFGRRICPGQNIAERSLYILISRIAWGCDIMKKKDKNGAEITPPSFDYVKGFNVQPNWFPFELSARDGRQGLIDSEWEHVWAERVKQRVGT